MTAQLTQSHLMGGLVGRGDEVGHGFGLREVHLAVQIGAHGELARAGHSAAVGNEQFQYLI